MKLHLHLLACAAVLGLLLPGCSKKTDNGEVTDELEAEGEEAEGEEAKGEEGEGFSNLPEISKLQPAKASRAGANTITRQADGLWHSSADSKPFSGTVVYEQDDLRWQEKFEKGVRVFVKAWDEDGDPVELHAWNADGSLRD
jgi:hypothetical protein